MKAIIKALSETEYKPRAKWWGFEKHGHQFLCRYHHLMAVFKNGEAVFTFAETRTDKAGLNFAIQYMKNKI